MVPSSVARKPHQVYRLANGERVPGVTTILATIAKPALPVWANKLGLDGINSTEYLRHVADAGTLAHAMVAHHLGGPASDTIGYSQDQIRMAGNAVSSFDAWARGKRLEVQATELSLISEAHCYGGTLDALLLVDGVLTVIDVKTSSAIYPEHLYQVSAYRQLLIENGYAVDAAMVLQVGRDAGEGYTERVLSGPEIEPYFAVFLAALLLKRAIDATRKRRGRDGG